MPVVIILKYFWFLMVPLVLINVPFLRIRARPLIIAGAVTHQELSSFLRGFVLLFAVPFLALGSLQLLGDFRSPFAIYCRPQENIWLALSWVIVGFMWVWFLWWVWLGHGTATLLKFGSLIKFPRTAGKIRWFATVLLAGGGPFLFLGSVYDLWEFCALSYL